MCLLSIVVTYDSDEYGGSRKPLWIDAGCIIASLAELSPCYPRYGNVDALGYTCIICSVAWSPPSLVGSNDAEVLPLTAMQDAHGATDGLRGTHDDQRCSIT